MKCESEWLRITENGAFPDRQDIIREEKAETVAQREARMLDPTLPGGPKRRTVPKDFIDIMEKLKTLEIMAHHYGVSVTTVFRWRRAVKNKQGAKLGKNQ
jgi:transposase-like protein